MGGWNYLVIAATCSCGMLAFLRTVACAIDSVDGTMRAMEERLRRERKAAEHN